MRILIAVAAFPPSSLYGGPATVAQQHAEVLSLRGHNVTVLTTDVGLHTQKTVALTDNPYDLIRLPAFFPGERLPLLGSIELPRWLRRHITDFDVVHVHFAREVFPINVAQAAWRAHIPYMLQPHGMISGRRGLRSVVDRLWVRRLLRDAGAVAALQDVEDAALGELEPRAHIVQVPNGMSIVGEQGSIMLGQSSAMELPTILFLARLHPRKRVLDFIKMADHLIRQGHKLHFRVVGPDGGERGAAEALVADMNLTSHFTFLGSLPPIEARREMASASVYVLPSVEEPFPMTVLEALSLGTPVIGTPTLHIRSLLEQWNAVRIADPKMNIPEALAHEVTTLLNDPVLAQKQAAQGVRLLTNHLTLDRVAERLEEAYLYARTHPTRY